MTKPYVTVLIACGSGIATSTIAADEVQEAAKDAGVRIRIRKGSVAEIPTLIGAVDIVLTTMPYKKNLAKPYLCVKAFLTGDHEEETKEELKKLLLEAREEE